MWQIDGDEPGLRTHRWDGPGLGQRGYGQSCRSMHWNEDGRSGATTRRTLGTTLASVRAVPLLRDSLELRTFLT